MRRLTALLTKVQRSMAAVNSEELRLPTSRRWAERERLRSNLGEYAGDRRPWPPQVLEPGLCT